MISEAEQRLSLVAKMNGAAANLKLAKDRFALATEQRRQIDGELATHHELYAVAFRQLSPGPGSDVGELDGPKRLAYTEQANEALKQIQAIKTGRLHAVQSEQGTAKSEIAKYEREYAEADAALKKLLPEPSCVL